MSKNNCLIILLTVIELILFAQSEEENVPKVTIIGNDSYVKCDQKTNSEGLKIRVEGRDKLCKVECITRLNEPGVCQLHQLNPCKTLRPNSVLEECKSKNNQNSDIKSICCPIKLQSNQTNQTNHTKPINDTNHTNGTNTGITAEKFGINSMN